MSQHASIEAPAFGEPGSKRAEFESAVTSLIETAGGSDRVRDEVSGEDDTEEWSPSFDDRAVNERVQAAPPHRGPWIVGAALLGVVIFAGAALTIGSAGGAEDTTAPPEVPAAAAAGRAGATTPPSAESSTQANPAPAASERDQSERRLDAGHSGARAPGLAASSPASAGAGARPKPVRPVPVRPAAPTSRPARGKAAAPRAAPKAPPPTMDDGFVEQPPF